MMIENDFVWPKAISFLFSSLSFDSFDPQLIFSRVFRMLTDMISLTNKHVLSDWEYFLPLYFVSCNQEKKYKRRHLILLDAVLHCQSFVLQLLVVDLLFLNPFPDSIATMVCLLLRSVLQYCFLFFSPFQFPSHHVLSFFFFFLFDRVSSVPNNPSRTFQGTRSNSVVDVKERLIIVNVNVSVHRTRTSTNLPSTVSSSVSQIPR